MKGETEFQSHTHGQRMSIPELGGGSQPPFLPSPFQLWNSSKSRKPQLSHPLSGWVISKISMFVCLFVYSLVLAIESKVPHPKHSSDF